MILCWKMAIYFAIRGKDAAREALYWARLPPGFPQHDAGKTASIAQHQQTSAPNESRQRSADGFQLPVPAVA